ncbi:UNKNOWN [Stylonychia lemnae]|uniref:Uncharacterized protein n=1 Tax=Stylonychia lemnae TaxID=5949 RepID=A0A078A8R0_STYLE|nr:UNKNOWN [Stylonychia lemnae]|eukprot:CDW77912.1 UNKNOWN [Stylonychia lemnae]
MERVRKNQLIIQANSSQMKQSIVLIKNDLREFSDIFLIRKVNLKMFVDLSGHLLHSNSFVLEQPILQSEHNTPQQPMQHEPIGSFIGSIIPKQAGSYRHCINSEELLDFLQNPGLGPIFEPPLHSALSEGQLLHSPGSIILVKEKL